MFKNINFFIFIFFILVFGGCSDEKNLSEKKSVKYHFYVIKYVDSKTYEEAEQGIYDGLKKLNLKLDIDYEIKTQCAQGDAATLSLIIDEAKTKKIDVIFTCGTPVLQAAIKKIKNIPIVFCNTADPIAAGAGKSFDDHLPNVTGMSTMNDMEGSIKFFQQILPGIKNVGSLYAPGEVNSVSYKKSFESAAKKAGLISIFIGINSSAEISMAAEALCSKKIEAIYQTMDNTILIGFSGISAAAKKNKIPIFTYISEAVENGCAIAAMSRDFYQCGIDATIKAAEILKGVAPKNIPITFAKTKITINKNTAAFYNIIIPDVVLKKADKIFDK